jgi:plastocyanin domain-containing protein
VTQLPAHEQARHLLSVLSVLSVRRVVRVREGRDQEDEIKNPVRGPVVTPSGNVVELAVTSNGFEPARVSVKKDQPVTLVITRRTDATCAKEIVVPDHGVRQALPLNQPVKVTFTPAASGELKYGCGMNQMVSGVLLVE